MQPTNYPTGSQPAQPTVPSTENPLMWPKMADRPRLSQYEHNDQLYSGQHYKAFAIKADKGFTERYAMLRYVAANFAKLISTVMADSMFGDGVTFDTKDQQNQKFLTGMLEDNHFVAQLYESELGNSRRGDTVFKIRIGQRENNPSAPSTVIIEEISPAIYFPTLDASVARFTAKEDVLIWQFTQNGRTYLHKEIHRPGYIFHEIYRYNPDTQLIEATENVVDFGYQPVEDTKVQHSLIFHIPNFRDGSYFGTSDYMDLESLFFALNNRITKVDNILDKHSDPILAVPPGVLDENGQVRKEALNMFEVDNENPGFNKPEYIVWNANLEWAFKEIDKLVDFLYLFSSISPGSVGYTSDQAGGQAQSGRALRFQLISTLRKRSQKIIYYDIAIKEMLEVAMELAKAWNIQIDGVSVKSPEKPDIKWGDGVLNDETEQTDIEVKRVEAGLSSRADSISRLDNIAPDDAKSKVKEIDAESAINVPSLLKPASPGRPALPAGEAQPPNPSAPGASAGANITEGK